jgi:hypothetical protein
MPIRVRYPDDPELAHRIEHALLLRVVKEGVMQADAPGFRKRFTVLAFDDRLVRPRSPAAE